MWVGGQREKGRGKRAKSDSEAGREESGREKVVIKGIKREQPHFFAFFHQDTHFCPSEKETMQGVVLCQKEKPFFV